MVNYAANFRFTEFILRLPLGAGIALPDPVRLPLDWVRYRRLNRRRF
jgi:hypothetical protein